jgi:hypothetical protein
VKALVNLLAPTLARAGRGAAGGARTRNERERRQAVVVPIRKAVLDGDVATLDEAGFTQAPAEYGQPREVCGTFELELGPRVHPWFAICWRAFMTKAADYHRSRPTAPNYRRDASLRTNPYQAGPAARPQPQPRGIQGTRKPAAQARGRPVLSPPPSSLESRIAYT